MTVLRQESRLSLKLDISVFSCIGCMGDTQFHFRIRQCPGRKHIVKSHSEFNKDCPTQLQVIYWVKIHNIHVQVISFSLNA